MLILTILDYSMQSGSSILTTSTVPIYGHGCGRCMGVAW